MDRPLPSLSSVLALTTATVMIVLVLLLVIAGLAGSHVLRIQARTSHRNDIENHDRLGEIDHRRSNGGDRNSEESRELQRPQAPTPCTGMRYEDMCSTCTPSTNRPLNLLHSGAPSSVYSVPTPTPSVTPPIPAKSRAGEHFRLGRLVGILDGLVLPAPSVKICDAPSTNNEQFCSNQQEKVPNPLQVIFLIFRKPTAFVPIVKQSPPQHPMNAPLIAAPTHCFIKRPIRIHFSNGNLVSVKEKISSEDERGEEVVEKKKTRRRLRR
ncbi:hypothetical protein BKA63DRAFT_492894 [Paraphoma chrysanthemicola]|nr:hypothetical protein BKA63DRAFT_492894 [Paraphoma chrysanthemicola]